MKTVIRITAGMLAGAFCVGSAIAQTGSRAYDPSVPLTRADVRADLVAWRAAGYDPLDWIDYPDNAQRAARIIAAQRGQGTGNM
ncbi:DUF4148 domain-containing protein [Paraburkholderia saeva]|uniref:DUF4148 domain-containing protein n=1 Tax=Paraburkholderia saeva TaxID=2777537 RepID=A0A9N8X1I1_9BURK|nr:DUF4148 domain-containing protein [Paraburkholderia saeva]CAG4886762.1 hypothetical protein R52603_00251 [Paraburkholderia saeva]CAG4894221.1 hypothetical protein LMG31841_01870 [Paraburkholderia saeva]CAG4899184.1 hypothetical protein R70241_02586 [Paraburkholderia saeva]